MDFQIWIAVHQYFSNVLYLVDGSTALKIFLASTVFILMWRLLTLIYLIANSEPAVHYVDNKRQVLQMTASFNPFLLTPNLSSASFSGIECTLKVLKPCYIQAFWGVPVWDLFNLLHKDWKAIKSALTSDIPSEKFSSKCVCANKLNVLYGTELQCDFKLPEHVDEASLFQEDKCMRVIYPLVVLMVKLENDEPFGSFVVAMASVFHIPDTNLTISPQCIGQFVKLSSGEVGDLKKTYRSSPSTPDDDINYDLCLACYEKPASMVYLPCRHVCLCNVCFEKCDKCPVCRTSSLQYFEVSGPFGSNDN